jgi:hypothetical protein
MSEAILRATLEAWATFYVITGSAAAALTGLQFVVVTLIDSLARDARAPETTSDTLGTFGTPTVVHFGAALLISAMMSAPWRAVGSLRTAVLLLGAVGVAYAIITLIRALRQKGYKPVLEDWIFHVVLPLVAYAGLVAAGALLSGDVGDALFVAGAVALLLLFIGIHNAWDTVAYLTVQRVQRAASASASPPSPAAPSPRRSRRRGR